MSWLQRSAYTGAPCVQEEFVWLVAAAGRGDCKAVFDALEALRSVQPAGRLRLQLLLLLLLLRVKCMV
jgi:hypothetical protein